MSDSGSGNSPKFPSHVYLTRVNRTSANAFNERCEDLPCLVLSPLLTPTPDKGRFRGRRESGRPRFSSSQPVPIASLLHISCLVDGLGLNDNKGKH